MLVVVLFLCTQRRQRWRVDAHRHLVLFCFCAPREDNDEVSLVVCLVLFCFCVPREDNNELMLIVIFFCFVYVHLEKTITSWCSSSSFFVLFLCT
jgi:hypothetical protein